MDCAGANDDRRGVRALPEIGRHQRDRHLIARGFYKIHRDPADGNPNPILVNPVTTLKSSKQVTAPLLCQACESRFDQRGEDWVLGNCWRNDKMSFQDSLCVDLGHSDLHDRARLHDVRWRGHWQCGSR